MRVVRLAPFLVACLLAALPAPAFGQAVPPPINASSRDQVDLGGRWRFLLDPLERGLRRSTNTRWDFPKDAKQLESGVLKEYDWDTSPELNVPGDWNGQREELRWYVGLGWYMRRFEWTPRAGTRALLHFEAVNYHAHVFLNGQKVGEHQGGFTPFAFDVTDRLKPLNTLVVAVSNTQTAQTIPSADFDWWNYGGITRPVSILVVPATYVDDFALTYRREAQAHVITGWVQLAGTGGAGMEARISIPEVGLEDSVRTGADGRAVFEFRPRALRLWSPTSPTLYRVVVQAGDDRVEEQVGFRTIAVKGTAILLNGQPTYLRGISLHEEPLGEPTRTLTWEGAEALLRLALDLNCNFVRLAHYPHSEKMTRLADRLGLLVWSEVPIYQDDIDFTDAKTLALGRQMLTENVRRDRNRASVVIWSVANETPVTPARTTFLETLVRHVRDLDGSRLVSAALDRNTVRGNTTVVDDPLGAFLDLLAVNTYVGWYGEGLPDVIASRRWETIYDKPMIFSEFGADALAGYRAPKQTRWSEEFQQWMHEETLKQARATPFIRGTSPWILKDFRSPRRWHGRFQNYWNRKGLVGPNGERKLAFETLRRWYADVQAREAEVP